MSNIIFQNYHRHSMYTNPRITDSVVSNEDYAKQAVEFGHGIISTMEHGSAGRYIEGYELSKKYGLKFVFGTEAYWVKNRLEKDRSNCHIYVGARNENGRQAINDILSEANITGYYGQPRLDIPLILSLPPEDVIITTACLAYWKYDEAEEITKEFAKRFGKNFLLEVQYHNTDKQIAINKRILSASKNYKIPIIMGCDSHYVDLKTGAQERIDFINSRKISYPDDEEGWYLDYPTGQEAYDRFAKQCVLADDQIMEAIENTNIFLQVEEYSNPCFTTDVKMPELHKGLTQAEKDEILSHMILEAWENEKQTIPQNEWDRYEAEVKKEFQIIKDTKHADYFMIDEAIVSKIKEKGAMLTFSGRGSAVSFYINKLLGITDVDRVGAKVKMYPERFMSATRINEAKTLADIDINVGDTAIAAEAQAEVIGKEHSYPMVAYGKLKPKAAWKMFARSQNVEFGIANAISEQIEKYLKAVKHAPEEEKDDICVDDYITDEYREIYEQSKKYQGIISDFKPHPSAYLLYQGDIRKEIGLIKIKDMICCVMDGQWAEDYKFLKNDLLKVSAVELIYKVFDRAQTKPLSVKELLSACTPDHPAWSVYANACTIGINQVEQSGTSHRVSQYKPKNISEMCAFVAAVRPGFKSMFKIFAERQRFSYGIKSFDELIQTDEMPDTFVLYQEMVMATLHYAGIPMDECYGIIKNIAKKRVAKVLKYKEQFSEGFAKILQEVEKKTPEEAKELSAKVWQIVEDNSAYSFNACVAGNTKIQKAGNTYSRFMPTIEEMYKIKNDSKYAKSTGHNSLREKYLRCGYGNALSMYDDGRIKKNKIIDIYKSGTRETFTVTVESGEYVVCTDNHKFPTPNGIKHLYSLNVGDELYVKDCYEINDKKYPLTDGNFESNVPKKGQRGFQKHQDGASVVFNACRAEKISQKIPCEVCNRKYDGISRFELHHIDGNRTNNCLENLLWCCASCHKKLHYQKDRRKIFEKGIPTRTEKIVSITPAGIQDVYDIEMEAPAHNFISENGLVTSNSHSYCVAIDSLYGAYLKTTYPLEFYEVFLTIASAKGEKERAALAKQEAEEQFHVNFPPFRYGQDNRKMTLNKETFSITSDMSLIKGFGAAVGEALYECAQIKHENFVSVLYWLYAHSLKASKIEQLIKIDYFDSWGTNKQLLSILQLFDFLNEGIAKKISKDKVFKIQEELPYLKIYDVIGEFATDKNAKGEELKSYTFCDEENGIKNLLVRCEQATLLENFSCSYKEKIEQQLKILGYIDLTTGKKEDRRKLIVVDDPMEFKNSKGVTWGWRISFKSLGTGKTSRLTVKDFVYCKAPLKKLDIIYASNVKPNNKGYWDLHAYEIVC